MMNRIVPATLVAATFSVGSIISSDDTLTGNNGGYFVLIFILVLAVAYLAILIIGTPTYFYLKEKSKLTYMNLFICGFITSLIIILITTMVIGTNYTINLGGIMFLIVICISGGYGAILTMQLSNDRPSDEHNKRVKCDAQ